MKTIENAAIVGMGAIGGAFYDHIARNAPDIRVCAVASGDRAQSLRRNGVRINGGTLAVAVSEPGSGETADLLVFAVKFGALAQAIEDARSFVRPDTVILSFLNGITSESAIAAAYGVQPLYSYCVGTDSTRTADEIVCRNMFRVPFGDARNEPDAPSENVRLVRDFFERVRMKYEIPDDMIRSMWFKYMLNIGVNQTLAVLRLPYAALQHSGFARETARDAMLEAITVANREGVALTADDAERGLAVIDGLSPQGKPSTLQDVEACRETEVEIFSGDLLRSAERHGLELPVNRLFYRLIKAVSEG